MTIQNKIDCLVNDSGQVANFLEGVEEIIKSLYTQLLGTKDPVLIGIDLRVARCGATLSHTEGLLLIQRVTSSEIDAAIQGIHSQKAPGKDGINSYSYKQVWHLIKNDIYNACSVFFKYGKFHKALNCTAITLIPKVPNVSCITQFHPISC